MHPVKSVPDQSVREREENLNERVGGPKSSGQKKKKWREEKAENY